MALLPSKTYFVVYLRHVSETQMSTAGRRERKKRVYSILFDSKKGIGNDIRVRDGANTVDSTQSHFHIE